MFFFLSIYHFWTLRIFELTDPQYLESPVTTADYFLALIGGCGKVNLISGAENDFRNADDVVCIRLMDAIYFSILSVCRIKRHRQTANGALRQQRKLVAFKMCLDNHQYHYNYLYRFCQPARLPDYALVASRVCRQIGMFRESST